MLLDEKQTRGSGVFQVNLTPLIDVSLVMVVTLLLMTPLALESGIWVRENTHAEAQTETNDPPALVHLQILSESLVQVENRVVQRAHLQPVLAAMLRQRHFGGVALGCANEVSHAAFVNVLDLARLSGARTIAIADGKR